MIVNDSNIDLLIVNSPARTGSTFLSFLLNHYFELENSKKYQKSIINRDVRITTSHHNFLLLDININNVFNLVTMRNPIDSLASFLIFSGQEGPENVLNQLKDNQLDSSINRYCQSFLGFFDHFYSSNNNILISFDILTKSPEDILKFLCILLNRKYDINYSFNINEAKIGIQGGKIPAGNMPQNDLIPYKEKVKKNILSKDVVKYCYFRYNDFLKNAISNNVMGLYGKNINS